MPGASRSEAPSCSPSPSQDSTTASTALHRLVVGVVAVVDVVAEQRPDRLGVIRLPGLDVVRQPPGHACRSIRSSFVSRRRTTAECFSAAPAAAACPRRCAAARRRTRSASAPCSAASDSAQCRRSSSRPRRRAVAQDHHGLHGLLPLGVGAADRGGVGDVRVAQQDLLDLGRQHVLAPGHDHVAEPVLDVEEALVVDPAEVAGVEPAVLVGAARRDDRALDQDLAVLDPQVSGEQRATRRAELSPRLLGGERGHLRGGLGEAVGLDHGGAAADRLLEDLERHRPAADQDRPRRRRGRPRPRAAG